MTINDLYSWEQQPVRFGSAEQLAQSSARTGSSSPNAWRDQMMGWQATPDQILLARNAQVSDLARKIGVKGGIAHADEQIKFLQGALNNPQPNLYRAPRDASELALQRAVQGDMNARQRGLNIGRANELENRKRAIEDMNNAFRVQDQAMQLGNFRRGIRDSDRSFALREEQLRDQAQDRDMKRAMDAQRFRTLGDEKVWDRAFSMMELGVPFEQIIRSNPALTPQQRAGLYQVDNEWKRQETETYGLLEENVAGMNARLREAVRRAEEDGLDPVKARERFMQDMLDQRDVRERMLVDPTTGEFKPFAPKPRMSTNSFVPQRAVNGVVQVRSAMEASQLPPGTRFRTPDGRIMVRP